MTSKHTPGPWAIERVWSDASTYQKVVAGASGDPVAYVVQPYDGGSWQDEVDANEALIVAAPALLDIVRQALGPHQQPCIRDPLWVAKARALVAVLDAEK